MKCQTHLLSYYIKMSKQFNKGKKSLKVVALRYALDSRYDSKQSYSYMKLDSMRQKCC